MESAANLPVIHYMRSAVHFISLNEFTGLSIYHLLATNGQRFLPLFDSMNVALVGGTGHPSQQIHAQNTCWKSGGDVTFAATLITAMDPPVGRSQLLSVRCASAQIKVSFPCWFDEYVYWYFDQCFSLKAKLRLKQRTMSLPISCNEYQLS